MKSFRLSDAMMFIMACGFGLALVRFWLMLRAALGIDEWASDSISWGFWCVALLPGLMSLTAFCAIYLATHKSCREYHIGGLTCIVAFAFLVFERGLVGFLSWHRMKGRLDVAMYCSLTMAPTLVGVAICVLWIFSTRKLKCSISAHWIEKLGLMIGVIWIIASLSCFVFDKVNKYSFLNIHILNG